MENQMGLTEEEARQRLLDLPDESLQYLQFAMPWQSGSAGDTPTTSSEDRDFAKLEGGQFDELRQECWKKYHNNPQINTAIRGQMGRVFGWGFEVTSSIFEIQEIITETEQDWRNRLYTFYPKYGGRSFLEGELHLIYTIHDDGFVEVDFLDPSDIDAGKGEYGIIWHPTKTCLPIMYCINQTNANGTSTPTQIPSIFVARSPSLIKLVKNHKDFKSDEQKLHRKSGGKFKQFGGYYRFVVSFDKGLISKRSISYLLTILQWLNHYENLKQYEIDHKKSSGAYLWVITMTDPKAFKIWLSLSDSEREKTGIMQKKTPGGTLVLPPGMTLECKNPSLTAINEQDTDILHMVTSGLNEPEDVSMGTSNGSFSSVKATRAPMSDRMSDEVAYLDRFLKFDFWASIFYLKGKMGAMPETYSVDVCVDFEAKKPHFKTVQRKPEQLLEISYPVSETIDLEGRVRSLLGVKHGPIAECLGMSGGQVADRIGIGGYAKMRRDKATEDKKYPKLEYNVDAETLQEGVQSGKVGNKGKATDGKKPENKE